MNVLLATSAERPGSAQSIQGSTRQRLQHPSTRRVYAVDNGIQLSKMDAKTTSSDILTMSSNDISTITNQDQKDNKATSNKDQQDPPMMVPLKHLGFRTVTSDPIVVRESNRTRSPRRSRLMEFRSIFGVFSFELVKLTLWMNAITPNYYWKLHG